MEEIKEMHRNYRIEVDKLHNKFSKLIQSGKQKQMANEILLLLAKSSLNTESQEKAIKKVQEIL